MARVSREQTIASHTAITTSSSRLIREHGLKNVTVADIMEAVGMTHGGFYKHFESKDALAAVACEQAFEDSAARWTRRVAKVGPENARDALIENYLSHRSRANPADGCPASALVIDVAREPEGAPIRAAFSAGVESLVAVLTETEASGSDAVNRERALADLSTMVGALVLSRATAGSDVSDALLAAASRSLKQARAAAVKRKPKKSSRH
jgi:TetR/AcrR family transcriptional repressor of nem operon